MYYKVLRDFRSCHGESFEWSEYLPKGDKPGKWTPPVDDVIPGEQGYHGCTAEQLPWWIAGGNMVFEAEYRTLPMIVRNEVVGRQMRLLRRVGHGEHTGGIVFALEGVTRVSGDERCIACGSSAVIACDRSAVEGRDHSVITAYDSSVVTAYGRSVITAYESSVVTAYGRSTITANGNSVVTASGSSVVTAKGSSVVTVWSRYVRYEIYDSAVVIDRSDGKLTIHTA